MPSPVSDTFNCTMPFARCNRISMRPPFGVNFVALPSRFMSTWWRRIGSEK